MHFRNRSNACRSDKKDTSAARFAVRFGRDSRDIQRPRRIERLNEWRSARTAVILRATDFGSGRRSVRLEPSANQGIGAGELIAGKYRIERTLGVGGMGTVVCAVHVHLGQRVAIKVLLPEHRDRSETVARFLREGQAVVRLKSEHVGKVIDVGQLPSGDPYLVMDYYEGSDLSQVVEAQGPLPLEQSVIYLLQACEAVAEAHAAGIIHRDLKPANLFLTKDSMGADCVKVLDFGISKVQSSNDSSLAQNASLTGSAVVMGSPLYMSPEQMKSSKDVDVRSDIWALGVIFFEFLTKRHPFSGGTLSEICIRVATDPAPLVRTARFDIPEPVDGIIQRCLAKQPEARYRSVVEFARAIAPFGGLPARTLLQRVLYFSGSKEPEPIQASVEANVSVPSKARQKAATSIENTSGTDLSWQAATGTRSSNSVRSAQRLRRVVAAALVLVTALVAVGWLLWRRIVEPETRAAALANSQMLPAPVNVSQSATVAPSTPVAASSTPVAISSTPEPSPIESAPKDTAAAFRGNTPKVSSGSKSLESQPGASATPGVPGARVVAPVENTPSAKPPNSKLPPWGGRE